MAKTRTSPPKALAANVRASVIRIQRQGEQMVGRLRRDAQTLVSRSRVEVMKEFRDFERRVLKALHGATREQVARLERRIDKLETAVEELRRPGQAA